MVSAMVFCAVAGAAIVTVLTIRLAAIMAGRKDFIAVHPCANDYISIIACSVIR